MRSQLESKDLEKAIQNAEISKASIKIEPSMFDTTIYKEKLNETNV